jgi:hypothetical protein
MSVGSGGLRGPVNRSAVEVAVGVRAGMRTAAFRSERLVISLWGEAKVGFGLVLSKENGREVDWGSVPVETRSSESVGTEAEGLGSVGRASMRTRGGWESTGVWVSTGALEGSARDWSRLSARRSRSVRSALSGT